MDCEEYKGMSQDIGREGDGTGEELTVWRYLTQPLLLVQCVFGQLLPVGFHGEADDVLSADGDQLLSLGKTVSFNPTINTVNVPSTLLMYHLPAITRVQKW